MSKEAKPADNAEAAPPKSKKMMIIVLALVLVLVIVGGGAAFLLMKKNTDEHADEEEAAEVAKPKKKDKKKDAHSAPSFMPLENFTVNLLSEGNGDQYLQIGITLELEDAHAEQDVKQTMPKIRNAITLLLSGKKGSELISKEGKENLSEELKRAMNDVIDPPKLNKKGEKVHSEDAGVKDVLFTSFIIQ